MSAKENELEELKEIHASKSNEEHLRLEEKLTEKLERLSQLTTEKANLETTITSLELVISERDQQLNKLSSEKQQVNEQLEKLFEEKSQLGKCRFLGNNSTLSHACTLQSKMLLLQRRILKTSARNCPSYELKMNDSNNRLRT